MSLHLVPDPDQGDDLDAHLDRIRADHPDITTAEAAELLPPHLRGPFWRRQVETWLVEQGMVEPGDLPGRETGRPTTRPPFA